MSLDIEAGHVSASGGVLFTVGVHSWLWDDLGLMADVVYKVLAGSGLIHRVTINLAFIGRLFL
ncbi:MAG: hypothetical protein JRH11_00015 [Deltaproteobacteria bacterium]|nr:hypothetical protein [Deltaproteobacteria bacterium]